MPRFRLKLYFTLREAGETEWIEDPIQCTYILSFAFFFVFAAFGSLQALQSSLNIEEGLGMKSLACIYAASLVSCILAPLFIKLLGGKLCTLIGFIVHALYVGSNFYPHFYSLIPSSLLLGLVTGPLWISQGLYITACASSTAQKHNKEQLHTLNRLNGIFYAIQGVAFAIGAGVSSVIFRNDINIERSNTSFQCGVLDCDKTFESNSTILIPIISKPSTTTLTQLISVYLSFDVIGLLLTVLFLPPLPQSKWVQNKTVRKSLYSMFSALSDIKLILLLPYIVTTGLLPFYLLGDFTKSYVSCPFGIGMVGYVMASFNISNTLFMKIVPKVAKCVHGNVLVTVGTVIYFGYMGLWLNWNPTREHLPLVFMVAVLAGITESVYKIDVFAKIPLLFPEKQETAFSNLQFWRGVAWTVYFATSSYLCVFTKVIIFLGILAISICLYSVLLFKYAKDITEKRPRKQDDVFHETLDFDEKCSVALNDEALFEETDKVSLEESPEINSTK